MNTIIPEDGTIPGPWYLGQKYFPVKDGNLPFQNVYGLDERHVARVIADETRAENARLISACPDLLAACESALRALRNYPEMHSRTKDILVTAIAKAKGK
jgi:hypothetical protein